MKTIKDLKQMTKEPASKEWFEKHGLPKGLGFQKKEIAKKMSAKDAYARHEPKQDKDYINVGQAKLKESRNHMPGHPFMK